MMAPNYISLSFSARDVNASSSLYSVGVPAIVSVSGFVDRLHHDLLRIGKRLDIRGFAIGYSSPKIVGHETRYNVALNVPRNTIDPADKTPSTSPRIAAKFQIVLQVSGGGEQAQIAALQEAIDSNPGLRFCGGIIEGGIGLRPVESFADLRSSYFIHDVSHEIAVFKAQDSRITLLEAMVMLCHMEHADGLRRYPNTLGFVSLEDAPKTRETGTYGSQLHVYAEPAVGIVQEIHTARLNEYPETAFGEVFPKLVFRKTFDERGSMYLKQQA